MSVQTLYTAATGMDMTAFHLARMDLPEIRAMAQLYPISQIFDNPAYPGLLASALIDSGIPAFTPEVGAPRILDHDMIPLFVEGTMNVLKHHGVIAGAIGRTGRDTEIFVGNRAHPVCLGSRGCPDGADLRRLLFAEPRTDARVPFGQTASQASVKVQAPKPSLSIC